MFTDTHCHLYKEYYSNIGIMVNKIREAGFSKVINNGCDYNSNIEVLDSIKKYDLVYGALGVHPEHVDDMWGDELDYVKEHIHDDKIVAIGEIGLDYHYTKENRDKQIELFRSQLKLAEENDIPVIIHSRDATLDTINILNDYNVRGVIHSFSGSYETACIFIKKGFLLGVNGVVTFKNCNLKDVLKRIDLSNIVLETDAPYLCPTPYRGERNDSSHIIDIAKYLCDLYDVSMDELSNITNENVKRVFDI